MTEWSGIHDEDGDDKMADGDKGKEGGVNDGRWRI